MTVATFPLPTSIRDSTIYPEAFVLKFAFSSSISATSASVSSRSSTPSPLSADTSTTGVSPPRSSEITSYFVSSALIIDGLASGRSHLFMATTIGTFAAFEWLIASIVCGITPSSAATTKTTISVTFAPLALICVNASWPGVSIKVIPDSPTSTL